MCLTTLFQSVWTQLLNMQMSVPYPVLIPSISVRDRGRFIPISRGLQQNYPAVVAVIRESHGCFAFQRSSGTGCGCCVPQRLLREQNRGPQHTAGRHVLRSLLHSYVCSARAGSQLLFNIWSPNSPKILFTWCFPNRQSDCWQRKI